MNILITNAALDRLAGTELVVDEVARELADRGHRVTAFTPRPGKLARNLSAAGIPVVSSPAHIPDDIDVIHGQHHLPTMIALAALPDVPAVYFVHGFAPWEEQPPRHPRIRRYLCVAPRLRGWLHHTLAFPPESTALVANWVDLGRFSQFRVAEPVPSRAIIFGNHCEAEHQQILGNACRDCGIALSKAGRAFDSESKRPESLLPDFDLAFASGRSALEAMASGCAVIPFRDGRIAPMVTPETFEVSAGRNFTVEPDGAPMDTGQVISEIQTFRPEAAVATTRRVRLDFGLSEAIDLLEKNYRSAVSENVASPDFHQSESACVADYLATLAAREMEQNQSAERRAIQLKSGWENTKRKREALSNAVGVANQKLKLVEKHLSRGAFRRPLYGRIRSAWREIENGSPRESR